MGARASDKNAAFYGEPEGPSWKDQLMMALIPLGTALAGGMLGGNRGAMVGAKSGLDAAGGEITRRENAEMARNARAAEEAKYQRQRGEKIEDALTVEAGKQAVRPDKPEKMPGHGSYEDDQGNKREGVRGPDGKIVKSKDDVIVDRPKPDKPEKPQKADWSQANWIQTQYDKDPDTKKNAAVIGSYTQAKALLANPSPAADLTLVYAFMKALDPGSVVRETEAETAQAIGGLQEQAKAKLSSMTGDGRLTPKQRADMFAQITKLAKSASEGQAKLSSQYRAQAERRNVSPEDLRFMATPDWGDSSAPKSQGGAQAPAPKAPTGPKSVKEMEHDELDEEERRLNEFLGKGKK